MDLLMGQFESDNWFENVQQLRPYMEIISRQKLANDARIALENLDYQQYEESIKKFLENCIQNIEFLFVRPFVISQI
jgi:hypothetical protein